MCFKGVGVSSILCTLFNHWVHKRCSGLKSKLASVINFKCKASLDPQVSDADYEAVELVANKYEVVKQFYYLGEMISAGGRAEASTIARVKSGWKSFRVLLPLLASRVIYYQSFHKRNEFFNSLVLGTDLTIILERKFFQFFLF